MTYHEVHGEGRLLVSIREALASLDMWKPQVEHLSPRYKVTSCEVPGRGKSERVDRTYSVQLSADAIVIVRPTRHASNLENPLQFNREPEKFLSVQTM